MVRYRFSCGTTTRVDFFLGFSSTFSLDRAGERVCELESVRPLLVRLQQGLLPSSGPSRVDGCEGDTVLPMRVLKG